MFVKHGSFYVRVHPCRLQLVKPAFRAAERNNPNVKKIDKDNTTQNKYHYETSLDSENRNENHSSDSEDEDKRETNNLTHHNQPLIVIHSQQKQTIHYSQLPPIPQKNQQK